MKKVIMIALIVVSALTVPAALRAAQWGLGVTTLYTAWEPAWEESFNSVDVGPVFMFGIVGTVSFLEKWNFTLIAMSGDGDAEIEERGVGVSGDYSALLDIGVKRHDLDGILSYRLFRGFSIFLGAKYMILEYDSGNAVTNYNGNETSQSVDFDGTGMKGYGGGAGCSFSMPLIENSLYFIINASFLFLNADVQLIEVVAETSNILIQQDKTNGQVQYRAYGANTTLSLSYYIEPISTAIVLGGRFQYLRYTAVDEDLYNFGSDIMYGMTLSAIYYF